MVKKILTLLFLIWLVLWVVFAARELFYKGQMPEYKKLISLSLEGKRASITGERLYEFIVFASAKMPKGSSYGLAGVEEGSLDKRRAVYYLYPNLEKPDAQYLLVFDAPDFKAASYVEFVRLDDRRYILKKVK
jgi:hypothetical protein